MQKGKVILVRNDSFLKVKERRFKLPRDKTTFIAQASYQKKRIGKFFPKGKEYWVGYYTESGQQRGLGFYKKKSEIPKKFRPAFAGLSVIKKRRR